MREWLVIESSWKNAVFASDEDQKPRGYIPRDVAEPLLGRPLDGTVFFTREESDRMRSHAEWRDTESVMKSLKQRVEAAMNTSLYGAKDRSRAKGLPLDITIEWLLELAEKQDFCCSLTGIQFFAFYTVAPAGNPYVPSLDRIDPKGGYTKDNVRIVIRGINVMLFDWGQDVFEQIVASYQWHQNLKNEKGTGTRRKKLMAPTAGT